MNKKAFFANIIKTIALFILCPILNLSYIWLTSSPVAAEPPSDVVIWIDYIFSAIIMIAPPLLFGRFILKDSGKISSNLISLLIPTIPLVIITVTLMNMNMSNDGVGFLISFMNLPGFILAQIASKCFSDYLTHYLMLNMLYSLCIGLSPLISMLISFLGLFWRTKHEEDYN